MDQINEHLTGLWGSMITLLDIDIKSHAIHCHFVSHHGDREAQTDVSLTGVETVCFGADLASQDMPQFMECVSIEARCVDIPRLQVSFHSNEEPSYSVQPNIIMEIDNSFLAVRANSIVIDGAAYSLEGGK